jgi:hypothetical protein
MSNKSLLRSAGYGLSATLLIALVASSAWAAPTDPVNPLKKRFLVGKSLDICDQGSFFISGVPKVTNFATSSAAGGFPQQVTIGQSYVQFQIPTKHHQWPIIYIHGSNHTGADVDATPNGTEGWLAHAVRNNFAVFVMDQPGRGRSGSDSSVIHEAKAKIIAGDVAGGLAMLPDIPTFSNDGAWRLWFGHMNPAGSNIVTGTMIRHGDPGDPDPAETVPPSEGHGNYPPAFPIPPIDSSIDANIVARSGAIGPAPNAANNAYLALNYYKQLVPNFEALLPPGFCGTCSPTIVPPDSAWDGLAMANLVERLGGAIVSPHSQSGIHILHMIRILRDRGELNLVKGIIIPESAIGLGNFTNAGIAPKDFDTIPLLLMNGDYRTAAARNGNRTMIAAINASPTRSVGPATYVDLDDPSFGGKFLGQTHMNMLGTTNIALIDYYLDWADKNIPNPTVATSCPSGKGQGNNGL